MEDFHQVSSIIDADKLPKTCRRVKITKLGSDKPLGFYIRDGISVRLTPKGLQKVASIFISRVLPGGLAESTGLLAVNDEVLEVNGIDILGKTIEQVTDMMVANASNLILTIKPASQNHLNQLNDSFMSTIHQSRNPQFNQPPNIQKQHQQDHQLQKSDQQLSINNFQPQMHRSNSNLLRNSSFQNNALQSNSIIHNVRPSQIQPNNASILQTNFNFPSHHQQQQPHQPLGFLNYQYSSYKQNQSTNQKNSMSLQHNSSFNYPKTSTSFHHGNNYQQENQFVHQKQQPSQQHQNQQFKINSNQSTVNKNKNSNQQLIYQNLNYQDNENDEDNFGFDEQNYKDEESDEQDEVVNHFSQNFDNLKLKNHTYQNNKLTSNQGLNVN